MIDGLEIVRQFLLVEGTALLTALGGNYVAIDRVPRGFTNAHPLVVLTQETGGAHVTGCEVRTTVMCRCYGGSTKSSEAREIFRAVYDRFLLPWFTDLDAGTVKQAFYLNDFPGPDDPVTGWPNHIGRFQIVTEE